MLQNTQRRTLRTTPRKGYDREWGKGLHTIARIRGTTRKHKADWLALAQLSGSDMFAACRAEERRVWTALVVVYNDAGGSIVVQPYFLSPASG